MNSTLNPADAIQMVFESGGFWDPANPECHNVKQSDLPSLKPSDEVVKLAFRSRSRMQAAEYAEAALAHHGRVPNFDGELGPAMTAMLKTPRCYVPDHAPPKGVEFHFDDPALQQVCERMRDDPQQAIGSGNWKRCHGVGDFHSAAVRIDRRGIGSHLQPVFKEVLTNVRRAYAKIGLLFRFIENGQDLVTGESFSGNYNIEFSFVQRSNGWIGLAIVGQNQSCGSNIWCRYLASYRPSNVINEWTTLIKHELGHNCGRGHTPGGVMNPSIVRGLPLDWVPSDPSYNWLRGQFGGVPVGDDGGGGGDNDDSITKRVKSLESQVDDLLVGQAVQDAMISYLVNK